MRISVNLNDLTPQQWRWVDEIWRPEPLGRNDMRACAMLAGPRGVARHIEVSVAELILAIGELERIDRFGLLAEAALTPDALPDHHPGDGKPPRTPAPVNDDLDL